jgi:hypothetical protein
MMFLNLFVATNLSQPGTAWPKGDEAWGDPPF